MDSCSSPLTACLTSAAQFACTLACALPLAAALPAHARPECTTPASTSAGVAARAGQAWLSTGPLITAMEGARHPIVAVKDPTVVQHDGRWHVIATTADTSGAWGMVQISFSEWSEAGSATPYFLHESPTFAGYNCAPQVFYFRPHKRWYLIFQSPQPRFSTTDSLDEPASWSVPQDFFDGTPTSVVEGWLDYWIICDDSHAYLFFSDDHGRLYRSRTSIADFPRGFDEPVVVMHESNPGDLFEGSCVFRIKATGQFLLLVECIGKNGPRYYRAFTADRLDGAWAPLPGADSETTPFAGNVNVSSADGSRPWADGISHGELLREGADETMTVDLQHLQLLYQGIPHGTHVPEYVLLPYRLALLTPASAAGR